MIITCVAGSSSRANMKFGGKAAMNGLFAQHPASYTQAKLIIIYLFLVVAFV